MNERARERLRARERAAPRARARTSSCCTTSRRSTCATGRDRRRRGAGALAAPRARPGAARREFIPLAEETGLIVADRRVGAARGLPRRRAPGSDAGSAACAVVGQPLGAPVPRRPTSCAPCARLLARDRARAGAARARDHRERGHARRRGRDRRCCRALNALGVRIAIDDFGTGYSSLRLPEAPSRSTRSRSTARSCATSAPTPRRRRRHRARRSSRSATRCACKVVAEGVETEEQLGFLRRHGCDEVQGFFYARPVPPEAHARLLLRAKRKASG